MTKDALSLPPQEITMAEVKHTFAWCYPSASRLEKVKLKTWKLYCEGYTKAGRMCPKFDTFILRAGLGTFVAAVKQKLISVSDIGDAQELVTLLCAEGSSEKREGPS